MSELRWDDDAIEAAIEEAMDDVCELAAKARRALFAPWLAGSGKRGVTLRITHKSAEGLVEYARAYAAASFEPKGVWSTGINYHADPKGCQDCVWANWNGEAIARCGWESEPPVSNATPMIEGAKRSSWSKKAWEQWEELWNHTWPSAFLDYCRGRDAVESNGYIATELICHQCSQFEDVEEDE